MDIISIAKAKKAKKKLDIVHERMGQDDFKNGSEDIRGLFASTKERIEKLEEGRGELKDTLATYKPFAIHGSHTNTSFSGSVLHMTSGVTSGEWVSAVFEMPHNVIDLDKVVLEGDGITASNCEIWTKSEHEDEFVLAVSGVIQSTIGSTLQIKIRLYFPTTIIKKIHVQYKTTQALVKISELTEHVNINILMHNLRVNALLNKKRYNLKEGIVDDLGDRSGIDEVKSANIDYDSANHAVRVGSEASIAQLEFVSEALDYVPQMITISASYPKEIAMNADLITEGITMTKDEDGYYEKESIWESGIVDLGVDVGVFQKITATRTTPTGTSSNVYISTSKDGLTFSEYQLIAGISSATEFGRFIKVRIEMYSKNSVITRSSEVVSYSDTELERTGNVFNLNKTRSYS